METIITAEFIQNLKNGQIVPNCFGQMKLVTEVFAKGISEVDGKMFACFYQEFGSDSKMSHSIREGQSIKLVK
jgi:hypothetical protein